RGGHHSFTAPAVQVRTGTKRDGEMSYPQELLDVAKAVVWWDRPEETLNYWQLFLAQLMTYGTDEEIIVSKRYFSDEQFKKVLEDPPSGVFDGASWTYWNSVYGRKPVPAMPEERQIPVPQQSTKREKRP